MSLVENLQKDIENWKKYCDEQENDITLKNNKICDLEFQVEKQQKEIEELKNADLTTVYMNGFYDGEKKWKDKIKAKIEENKWAIEHYDCDEADYKQSQSVGAWNALQCLLKESEI